MSFDLSGVPVSKKLRREAIKNPIESLIMIIPDRGWGITVPWVFILQCSKPSCLALGSPKTNLVFTQNPIFHINFIIFGPVYLASHLQFVETCYVRHSRCYAQILPQKFTTICFTMWWTIQMIRKLHKEKNLR